MNKRLLRAAATAAFVFLGCSTGAFAAPPNHAGDHHEFSAEDRAALTDAHIAALKAGLKLTPAQEKNWPALETVLRDAAKARAARMSEWREKAREHHEHRDVIEGMRQRANDLGARAAEMTRIADAAKPLYDGLDDAQKRRFGILLHAMAQMHGHMGHMSMGHMEHMGGRHDDHEDGGHSEEQ